MISAIVICDSVSEEGHRLTTFKLRYPRFIHSEFLTHRMISRNASGSRAVPTAKLLEEVRSDALRASPIHWGQNQKGMQSTKEFEGRELADVKEVWRLAAHQVALFAEAMMTYGAHKQIVNRLLEPFCHINVIATATEWDNFFGLRLHRDVQPEIQALARQMWTGLQSSSPIELKLGEWHTPFVNIDDAMEIAGWIGQNFKPVELMQELKIKTSVARCARVSYESFETGRKSTVEEDLKLYDRLLGASPIHASPAEHQATPDSRLERAPYWCNMEQHGNFFGWRQYRKMLKGEAVAPLPDEFLPF